MTETTGRDPSLLVLISLSGGPKFGHPILIDVAGFSGALLAALRLRLSGLGAAGRTGRERLGAS